MGPGFESGRKWKGYTGKEGAYGILFILRREGRKREALLQRSGAVPETDNRRQLYGHKAAG
jgi:hypothetical protein